MSGATDLEIADRLGVQLIRLLKLVGKAGAQCQASHQDGIERASYALLACLVTDGPRRTTALAESVHSDTSTVSRQVSALVQHGLVERRPDPADGRACILAATATGEQVYERNRRVRNRYVAELLADWSEQDRRQLIELLSRFNTEFETKGDQR
jgi:DNA-binding MarR family transcriptional regulator